MSSLEWFLTGCCFIIPFIVAKMFDVYTPEFKEEWENMKKRK